MDTANFEGTIKILGVITAIITIVGSVIASYMTVRKQIILERKTRDEKYASKKYVDTEIKIASSNIKEEIKEEIKEDIKSDLIYIRNRIDSLNDYLLNAKQKI